MSSTATESIGSDELRAALLTPPSTAGLTDRLARLSDQAVTRGADVVVVSPGADMRYFVGHSVASHERLTCLVVPAEPRPVAAGAHLERLGWTGTPVESLGIPIITWTDGEDPYAVVAALLPADARAVAVDDHMPAVHALGAAGDGARLRADLGRRGDRRAADAQGGGRGRRAGGRRRGHRPGAAPDRRMAAARPHRERGRRRHRRGHRRRGPRRRGLRHRRVGSQRRQPAPRGLRPGDPGRRTGGDRHRRPEPRRLLLRLHPHLPARGRRQDPAGGARSTRSSGPRRRPGSPRCGRASRAESVDAAARA